MRFRHGPATVSEGVASRAPLGRWPGKVRRHAGRHLACDLRVRRPTQTSCGRLSAANRKARLEYRAFPLRSTLVALPADVVAARPEKASVDQAAASTTTVLSVTTLLPVWRRLEASRPRVQQPGYAVACPAVAVAAGARLDDDANDESVGAQTRRSRSVTLATFLGGRRARE